MVVELFVIGLIVSLIASGSVGLVVSRLPFTSRFGYEFLEVVLLGLSSIL